MDSETLYAILSDEAETAVRKAGAEEELIRRNASANKTDKGTDKGNS